MNVMTDGIYLYLAVGAVAAVCRRSLSKSTQIPGRIRLLGDEEGVRVLAAALGDCVGALCGAGCRAYHMGGQGINIPINTHRGRQIYYHTKLNAAPAHSAWSGIIMKWRLKYSSTFLFCSFF